VRNYNKSGFYYSNYEFFDFLEATNNPIPIPERTTGIIQEND
jgi:hypothetical protein